jgi:hypothetical protein
MESKNNTKNGVSFMIHNTLKNFKILMHNFKVILHDLNSAFHTVDNQSYVYTGSTGTLKGLSIDVFGYDITNNK